MERAGAKYGTVPTELEAIAIYQPGNFVLRRMKGPEAQGQNDTQDSNANRILTRHAIRLGQRRSDCPGVRGPHGWLALIGSIAFDPGFPL